MTFVILLLSVIFAAIQLGLSWLMLAFEPVSSVFSGMPVWLITGINFGASMLISFIIIIIIGAMGASSKAADFVRDHFGRTLLLGLLSVALVFGLGMGAEALYQLDPIERPAVIRETAPSGVTHVCYVLDYSDSMANSINYFSSTTLEEAMEAAFANDIAQQSDGTYVSVVSYNSAAWVTQDWVQLDANSRQAIINSVNNETHDGATNFNAALGTAASQCLAIQGADVTPVVIMLSDGEHGGYVGGIELDPFVSVQSAAPSLISGNIPVYTLAFGSSASQSTLQRIANETGGSFNVTNVDDTSSSVLLDNTVYTQTSPENEDHIADTLLTERDAGREGIFNIVVLRILLVFIVAFIFKLITVICVGNNRSRFIVHFLHAFIVAIIAALVVEFGYMLGLPLLAVLGIFWCLMMYQFVVGE